MILFKLYKKTELYLFPVCEFQNTKKQEIENRISKSNKSIYIVHESVPNRGELFLDTATVTLKFSQTRKYVYIENVLIIKCTYYESVIFP